MIFDTNIAQLLLILQAFVLFETIAENDTIFAILQKFNTLNHSQGLNPMNYHSASFECNTGFYYLNRGDTNTTFARFLCQKLQEENNGDTSSTAAEQVFQYKNIKFNLYWPQSSA